MADPTRPARDDADAATLPSPTPRGAVTRAGGMTSILGVAVHLDGAATTFLAGEVVCERYRISGLLGRGGMGEVYAAHDRALGVDVALKTVRLELASHPAALERVKREILLARRVAHPQVCKVYDLGLHRGATGELPIVTMELLRGQPLSSRIAHGRLTVDEARPLVMQMVSALGAAHAADVLHRDFKPCNVMLVPGRGAVVTDFGVAHALREAEFGEAPEPIVDLGSALRTQTTHAGTPAYMAPEQAAGLALGPAADIYALGVVLYEMLTGELPFLGRTPFETALKRLDEEAPRVKSRVPGIDRRWDEVVARCLARDPADRFARAEDVVRALTPPRRRRRWIAAGVAVAGAALVAGGALVGGAGRARAAVPRVCPAPALPDLHVDAAAPDGGNGSAACPFRTITAALATTAERRVIHVAAGRYDAAHGEALPLIVRGATAIEGAGPDRTIVSGVGYYDPRPDGVTYSPYPFRAALVVGDDAAEVRLAGLNVDAGDGGASTGRVGIACTRGNLVDFERAPAAPNTRLDHVVVGAGFEYGAVVTGSSSGTGDDVRMRGCNLAMTDGLIQGGANGVWQVGCGVGNGHAPTALQVKSTVFRGLTGYGIQTWDCARSLRVEDSRFDDGDVGIAIVRHSNSYTQHAVIAQNEIVRQRSAGIGIDLAVDIELRDNVLADNGGVAIRISTRDREAMHVIARGNQMWNNLTDVEVAGGGALPAGAVIDFGRRGDPGGNKLRCASASRDHRPGPELALRIPAEPGAQVGFFGNKWDHLPPRIHRGGDVPTGTDIALLAAAPAIDFGDPIAAVTACGTD